jgi:hypothetical protein
MSCYHPDMGRLLLAALLLALVQPIAPAAAAPAVRVMDETKVPAPSTLDTLKRRNKRLASLFRHCRHDEKKRRHRCGDLAPAVVVVLRDIERLARVAAGEHRESRSKEWVQRVESIAADARWLVAETKGSVFAPRHVLRMTLMSRKIVALR